MTLKKKQCTDFILLKYALLIVLYFIQITFLAYKNKTISLTFFKILFFLFYIHFKK